MKRKGKIKCVLSIKEFSITKHDKETNYIAIYPSDVAEDIVDRAIKEIRLEDSEGKFDLARSIVYFVGGIFIIIVSLTSCNPINC